MDNYIFQTIDKNKLILTKYNRTGLENVVIPEEVEDKTVIAIGEAAFKWAIDVVSVVIPACVEKIEDSAFERANNLREVIMKEGIKTIGESAFGNCGKLEKVILPNSVESIGEFAFGFCTKLKEIVIPENLREIPSQFVADCESLEKIVIPASVTKISDDAMENCDKVTIYTEEGSFAQAYAIEKGIPFKIVDASGYVIAEQIEDEEFLMKKQKRMSQMNDSQFGELKYESSFWKCKKDFVLYGKTYPVTLEFNDDEKVGITQRQRDSYQQFTDANNYVVVQMEEEIYKYYQQLIVVNRAYLDEEFLNNMPVVNRKEDLASLIKPKELIFTSKDYMNVLITFDCKWDFELGMAVEIKNNEVVAIGYEPDIL